MIFKWRQKGIYEKPIFFRLNSDKNKKEDRIIWIKIQ